MILGSGSRWHFHLAALSLLAGSLVEQRCKWAESDPCCGSIFSTSCKKGELYGRTCRQLLPWNACDVSVWVLLRLHSW
jgi:hypothetical protein